MILDYYAFVLLINIGFHPSARSAAHHFDEMPTISLTIKCPVSYQIAALEIGLENVLSTVTNIKEGSLKLKRLLSPPSCPSSEGQSPPRIVAQNLLDLQLYNYNSTSTLVAAWRWHWVESSDIDDMNTVTKNGLSAYVLISQSSPSVLKVNMEMMMDTDGTGNILFGLRHCMKEDLALCKLMTDSTPSGSGVQLGDALLTQKLKVTMISYDLLCLIGLISPSL